MDLPNDAPRPRLCHLIKRVDFVGYGFNLHAERNKVGQYVGKVDDGSPASLSGMKEHDRIVEVNGVNIGNENHKQVVERIKTNPNEAQLLVVDRNTDSFYKDRNVVIKGTMSNVLYLKTPTMEEEEILNESMAKRVTIAEPAQSKDQRIDEDYDPHYATIATPSPPPPPEESAPPSPPSPPSPAVNELAPSDDPHDIDPEDLPLPPAPVLENESPGNPTAPRSPALMVESDCPSNPTTTLIPEPLSEDIPTPLTPPIMAADVSTQQEASIGHNQELEIQISTEKVGTDEAVTPPPPYDSVERSVHAMTPEASPLPSPTGNAAASSIKASPDAVDDSPSVSRSQNNNNYNNSSNSSNQRENPLDGDPNFGLSVADMRARLNARKKVDVRASGNFKEKYDIFQKL